MKEMESYEVEVPIIHPGVHLQQIMDMKGISLKEFCKVSGIKEEIVEEVLFEEALPDDEFLMAAQKALGGGELLTHATRDYIMKYG